MNEIERMIQYYKDDGVSKIEFVNALRSLSRKEKDDKSLGILIRYFLDQTSL